MLRSIESRAPSDILQPALPLFRIIRIELYTDHDVVKSLLVQAYERLVRNFDLQQTRPQPADNRPGFVASVYTTCKMVGTKDIAFGPLRVAIADKADDIRVGRYEVSVGTNFFTN